MASTVIGIQVVSCSVIACANYGQCKAAGTCGQPGFEPTLSFEWVSQIGSDPGSVCRLICEDFK